MFKVEAYSREDLESIIKKAFSLEEKPISMSDQLVKNLAQRSDGDARKAINLVEALLATSSDQSKELSLQDLEMLEGGPRFDKDGEEHYNLISALIKSMRASKPQAALYYLARLIEGGEEPSFIARRMLIFASEDIGNANPTALLMAHSTHYATEVLGYPEARISLGQLCSYLACSPKSRRAYEAIGAAQAEVRSSGSLPVPAHLVNSSSLTKMKGYGMQTASTSDLPLGVVDRVFYKPSEVGVEKSFSELLRRNSNN